MKTLRYGIISASSIVPRFIRAVKDTNHSQIFAIASQSNKADALAQEFNIEKVYHSYADLYQDEDIDIVYIATINDQHYQEIKNALHANKHVLCEKPFVLHPDEVSELFELAQSKNLFLMEAQKSPFLPTSLKLKRIINENQLGPLVQISMNNSWAGRHPEGHWMHQAHQGGVWVPSANYILEFLHTLLDSSPLEINAMYTTYSQQKTIDEIMLTMRYPKDVLAQVSLTVRTQTDDMSKFFFEKGWVEIHQNWKARNLVIKPFNKPEQVFSYPVDHELIYEVNHVYEMINQEKITSTVLTPEVTYDCVNIVYQIYTQSQED